MKHREMRATLQAVRHGSGGETEDRKYIRNSGNFFIQNLLKNMSFTILSGNTTVITMQIHQAGIRGTNMLISLPTINITVSTEEMTVYPAVRV